MEEISDRTKINMKYLYSIESGEFSEIEIPYLRLFLRAYAEEIGGDSNRALEQLDSYLGTSRPISHKALATKDEHFENQENFGGFLKIFFLLCNFLRVRRFWLTLLGGIVFILFSGRIADFLNRWINRVKASSLFLA